MAIKLNSQHMGKIFKINLKFFSMALLGWIVMPVRIPVIEIYWLNT